VELRIIRLVFTLLFVGFLTWWATHTTTWPFFVAAIIFGVFSLPLWVKEAEDRNNKRVMANAPGPRGHGAPMINQAQMGTPPMLPQLQQPATRPPAGQYNENFAIGQPDQGNHF
jgi:hypothetical protein